MTLETYSIHLGMFSNSLEGICNDLLFQGVISHIVSYVAISTIFLAGVLSGLICLAFCDQIRYRHQFGVLVYLNYIVGFFSPQSSVKTLGPERLIRTSLDLELDLQASKTWHSQLLQEISVLKQLKEQLEQAQSQGEKELPRCIDENEQFRMLMRLVEKKASILKAKNWFLFSICPNDSMIQERFLKIKTHFIGG